MRQSYPGINPDISQWKGQDIADFQEDLLSRVNGRLSVKWFYTHMKSPVPTIPRIDALNMLSRYAGYINWQDFAYRYNGDLSSVKNPSKTVREFLKIFLLLISISAVVFLSVYLINTQSYSLTFYDNITGEPVITDKTRVTLLLANESPVMYTADNEGKIVVKTSKGILKMVVTAPYYLPDTVNRSLRKLVRNEKIGLEADSYAMMIRYFSESDVAGWEKRRQQLEGILHDDALIYRLSGTNGDSGMELFNKQEFIDRLTMPSSGLKNLEVLESRYLDDQIILLRYRLKETGHE